MDGTTWSDWRQTWSAGSRNYTTGCIAVATVKDKIVQGAAAMVLSAIYEGKFPRVLLWVPNGTWLRLNSRPAKRARHHDPRLLWID